MRQDFRFRHHFPQRQSQLPQLPEQHQPHLAKDILVWAAKAQINNIRWGIWQNAVIIFQTGSVEDSLDNVVVGATGTPQHTNRHNLNIPIDAGYAPSVISLGTHSSGNMGSMKDETG